MERKQQQQKQQQQDSGSRGSARKGNSSQCEKAVAAVSCASCTTSVRSDTQHVCYALFIQVDSFNRALSKGGASGTLTNLFKSKLSFRGMSGDASPVKAALTAAPSLSADEMLTWDNVSGAYPVHAHCIDGQLASAAAALACAPQLWLEHVADCAQHMACGHKYLAECTHKCCFTYGLPW